MPVAIVLDYDSYQRVVREGGTLDLSGTRCVDEACRRESGGAPLRPSRSRVVRGVVILRRDEYGEWSTREEKCEIVLAYCGFCKHRPRVLPRDVLPSKIYSLVVIDHLCSRYGEGQRSLRQVVWDLLGERCPAHTTLHAWGEGLGAHAQGRAIGETPLSEPMSRLHVETEGRVPEIASVRETTVIVPPERYQSLARLDRLVAVARVLLCAEFATGCPSPESTSQWRALAVRWGLPSPLIFRTGISCTSSEQAGCRPGASSGSSHHREVKPWQTPTRSPPGDTSRSLQPSTPP